MRLIEADTAERYLRDGGHLVDAEKVTVRELAGGVSNLVLYVERDEKYGESFVLKQARDQLRVADPWFCSVERIWREVETLQICTSVLADADLLVQVPRVLLEDRDNYVFAMTAAPPHHTVWKQQLLDGDVQLKIAEACGRLLGTLHGRTRQDSEVAKQLDDRQFFDDLRLDPYYRHVARGNAEMQPAMEALIDSVLENRWCLVHGDFSPKNLLVYDGGLMMIDFEVGHYGDGAFDLGFFLSHLVLKAVKAAPNFQPYLQLTDVFWSAYTAVLSEKASPAEIESLIARAIQNFAGCALARIDGKSKVDYLDESRQNLVRGVCRTLLMNRPTTWDETTTILCEAMATL